MNKRIKELVDQFRTALYGVQCCTTPYADSAVARVLESAPEFNTTPNEERANEVADLIMKAWGQGRIGDSRTEIAALLLREIPEFQIPAAGAVCRAKQVASAFSAHFSPVNLAEFLSRLPEFKNAQDLRNDERMAVLNLENMPKLEWLEFPKCIPPPKSFCYFVDGDLFFAGIYSGQINGHHRWVGTSPSGLFHIIQDRVSLWRPILRAPEIPKSEPKKLEPEESEMIRMLRGMRTEYLNPEDRRVEAIDRAIEAILKDDATTSKLEIKASSGPWEVK